MSIFRIKLRKTVNPETINKVLDKMKIKYFFNSPESNQEWLNNINTDPQHAHMKPEGRDMTMQELEKQFGKWAELRLLEADMSFSRCPDAQKKKLAKFVFENSDSIKFVENIDDMLDVIPKKHAAVLDSLEKKPLPKLKTPEEDRREMPASGQMLAQTWGPKGSKVWLIFGNVEKDSPVFLKEDVYVRKSLNRIHKDEEGRAFLLMPLFDFSPGFAKTVTDAAWKMSIREHPNYILSGLYGNCFEIQDVKGLAESFADFYELDELKERFIEQFARVISTSPFTSRNHLGFHYNPKNKIEKLVANGENAKKQVAFLNSLAHAISIKANEDARREVMEHVSLNVA